MINYFIFISLMILLFGIYRAFLDRNDLKKTSGILTASVSLAISVLSLPYFLGGNDLLVALFKAIRYGPSCIGMSVNGDIVDELGMRGHLYHYLLYFLYIIGPIVASIFVIAFFRTFNELLLSLLAKHVHVFSELNERSMAVGESIAKAGTRNTIVYCNSNKAKNESLKIRARSIRALLLNLDISDVRLLKSKRYEFYVIDDDDNDCLNRTVKVCDGLFESRNYEMERVIVRSFVNRKQKDLVRSLDRKYGQKVNLRYLDVNSSIAIEAMRKAMDSFIAEKDDHVLIVGEGDLIMNLLEDCLTLPVLPLHRQRVDIISPEADRIAGALKSGCPEILDLDLKKYFTDAANEKANYDIHFYQSDYDGMTEILNRLKDVKIVFVCANDDLNSYNVAKQIRRHYGAASNTLSYPDIFCRIREKEYRNMIEEVDDLVLFGNDSDLYDYDYLINPYLEKAAKKTHLAYICLDDLAILEADRKRQEDLLRETGFYNYTNQDSSFISALSLEYKKAYILSLKKKDGDDDAFIDGWFKNERNLQKMADCEHDRWVAYQRFLGYRHPNRSQQKKIIEDFSGARVKDDELLLHPAIVPNRDLTKTEEQVNRLRKRCGSNDRVTYTKTDKIIIRNLTRILR